MKSECVANQKEFQDEFQTFKTTVAVVQRTNKIILLVLAGIFLLMVTAVTQNHLLDKKFVLLEDSVNDHLEIHKKINGYFADLFAEVLPDDDEHPKKKKELYAKVETDE